MPPPTIVTTSGAADANSFADVDYYKIYWAGHLFNTAALAATDDTIAAALLQTGRALNAIPVWTGSATLPEVQAMTWPRRGMVSRNNSAIGEMVIPNDLKDAQCEWAGQYISKNLFATNTIQASGISSAKAGPVSVSYQSRPTGGVDVMEADFRRSMPELAWASTEVPDFVRNLLVPSWYDRQTLAPPFVFEGHR